MTPEGVIRKAVDEFEEHSDLTQMPEDKLLACVRELSRRVGTETSSRMSPEARKERARKGAEARIKNLRERKKEE